MSCEIELVIKSDVIEFEIGNEIVNSLSIEQKEIELNLENVVNDVNIVEEKHIDINFGEVITISYDDTNIQNHLSNTDIHMTAEERTTWNTKSNLTLGETSDKAFVGDKGKIAYEHSQASGNPHGVSYSNIQGTKPTYTKSEIGLGNNDNTSDLDKPVSTAQQQALDLKVDKETGKRLITDEEASKLSGVDDNANNYVLPEDVVKESGLSSAISSHNTDLTAHNDLRTLIGGKQDNLGFTPENIANKGINNGYASLDSGGKIPANQLPNSVMDYKGNWNANTNIPTLADGTGNSGDVYKCTVTGSVNFGSGLISFNVGDFVIYNGTIWEKSNNSNEVVSVNNQKGVIVLDSDDIQEGEDNKYLTGNEFQKNTDTTDDITEGITKKFLTGNEANTNTENIFEEEQTFSKSIILGNYKLFFNAVNDSLDFEYLEEEE